MYMSMMNCGRLEETSCLEHSQDRTKMFSNNRRAKKAMLTMNYFNMTVLGVRPLVLLQIYPPRLPHPILSCAGRDSPEII